METAAFELDLTIAYGVIAAVVLGVAMGLLFQPLWAPSRAFARAAWAVVLLGMSWLLQDSQGGVASIVLAGTTLVSSFAIRAEVRRRERRGDGDPGHA